MNKKFKDLMALSEASALWGLEESTLRKAISSNRFVVDEDVKKFGKQWIITKQAMEREYGYLDLYDEGKMQDVYYYIFECFYLYMKKYNIAKKEARQDFTKYNIFDYLCECYDYLHLQNTNQTVIDIHERIQKRIKYKNK